MESSLWIMMKTESITLISNALKKELLQSPLLLQGILVKIIIDLKKHSNSK